MINEQVETGLCSRKNLLLQTKGARAEGWGREKRPGEAQPAHADPRTHSSRTPRPCCSWRSPVKATPGSAPLTLQRRPEGLVRLGRGGRPEETQTRPLLRLPLAPSTRGNSPSRQAQEVQEGETDPEGHRDRRDLLGRNHLCNMPYFKPVQVSGLSRCPEQGARRGQRLSAACAHSPALSQPQPRWARVCARAGEADPAFPRPLLFSPSSPGYGELRIPLTRFLARTPKRPELTPGARMPAG